MEYHVNKNDLFWSPGGGITSEQLPSSPPHHHLSANNNSSSTSSIPPSSSTLPIPTAAGIDIFNIRSKNRAHFLNLLKRYPNQKYLSLDAALIKPLGILVEVAELKNHGVEGWTECGSNFLSPDIPLNLIFICRPNVGMMQHIIDQITTLEEQAERLPSPINTNKGGGPADIVSASGRCYCIAFIPAYSEACMLALKMSQALSRCKIVITVLPIYFLPLEVDVLSMELQNTFLNVHAHNDPHHLMFACQAILQLQEQMGKPITHVRAIGTAANYVSELLINRRKEALLKMSSKDSTTAALLKAGGNCLDYEGNQNGGGGSKYEGAVPPVSFLLGNDKTMQNTTEELEGMMSLFKNSFTLLEPTEGSSLDGGDFVETENEDDEPNVDFLILIDRRTDLYTPLCSPFTYEALLDVLHGISCTHIELTDSSHPLRLNSKTDTPEGMQKTRVELNSNDKLFASLRNLHQSTLGPCLHEKAREIQEVYKEKESLKDIGEITKYMKKFKMAQIDRSSLSAHVELASQITAIMKESDYHYRLKIEDEVVQSDGGGATNELVAQLIDMIERSQPLSEVYRLMCLTSLVNNGIATKVLNSLKTSILQQYGFEEFLRFSILHTVGLLRSPGKSHWSTIKKNFNLLIDENESMQDISSVFSGYAPLSVRLVQLLFSLPMGWRSCLDNLNLLYGPALELKQQHVTMSEQLENDVKNSDGKERAETQKRKSVLIFFLGGVTYAEVAAIRKLSEIEKHARRYIVATTEMVNARTLFDSFLDVQAMKKLK